MNDKMEAGRRVAGRLFPAESTIDDALIANAALQLALLTTRRDIRQPFGFIQSALADTVASASALVEARRAVASTHGKILKMRETLGLPGSGFGCETVCGPGRLEEGGRLNAA